MDFSNFFLYTEKAVSEGLDVGFSLFGSGHIKWLVATVVAAVLVTGKYAGFSEDRRTRTRKNMALYLLFSEIAKDTMIVLVGADIMGYLPLHLCSFAIFGLLVDAFNPEQKITGSLLAYGFAPGALSALLFSNWTELPVFMNAMSIHSFIFHAVIVIYFVMRFANGEIEITYSGVWKTLLAMIIVSIPVLIFDIVTDTNYLFLYKGQDGSPLEFIWDILGVRFGLPGFLAGYFLLAIVVLHICFVLYSYFSLAIRPKNNVN